MIMPVIGVRELKIHASEIIRRVRDEHDEYVITFHGRPVGLLIPIDEKVVNEGTVSAARVAAQEVVGKPMAEPAAAATPVSKSKRVKRAQPEPVNEQPLEPEPKVNKPRKPEPAVAKPKEPEPSSPAPTVTLEQEEELPRTRQRRKWARWSR
jgi:prevent-host-death family protein